MMTVQSWGERGIVQHLARLATRGPGVVVGTGDDAAGLAFPKPKGQLLLVACDALVEGVHFSRRISTPEEIGGKLAAVNLSDIAAMGGKPLALVTTMAFPATTSVAVVQGIARGIRAGCRKYGAAWVGGDTTGSPAGIFLDATVLGTVTRRRALRRRGARPGDTLVLLGECGLSALALDGLRRGQRLPPGLRRRHVAPRPLLAEGEWCARSGMVSALTDLSDSLREEIENLTVAFGRGARVALDRLPAAGPWRGIESKRRLAYQLDGGEDHSLLAAVRKGSWPAFLDRYPRPLARPVPLGLVTGTGKLEFTLAGQPVHPPRRHYRHFITNCQ